MNPQLATVVTGGASGIGLAITLEMSKLGVVLFTARDEQQALKACELVSAQGGTAEYCIGDVSDPDLAALAAAKAKKLGWTVNRLICNAGISGMGAIGKFDQDEMRRIMAVNYFGAFYFVQSFLTDIEAQKGSICFIAGQAAVEGYGNMEAYNASKFALRGLALSLSKTAGRKGVRVIPACPGPVDTKMTDGILQGLMQKRNMTRDQAAAVVASGSGQQRLLTPQEVAVKVAFICSPEFDGKNGEPYLINDK